MTTRVELVPEMITWARERAGLTIDDLGRRFKRLAEWESGEVNPTLRQVQDFASATRTPVGYLFLEQPPDERLPVSDFRRLAEDQPRQPSPDLLDTIYMCQQRQEWYRNFALSYGEDRIDLVGAATTATEIPAFAAELRERMEFGLENRAKINRWTDALRFLRQRTEDIGILVMISGIVGSNTHRKLDVAEFRGFALSDPIAPLIFVNGSDTKAAQIFTIVHEIGHILLGETGVSNPEPRTVGHGTIERWCNAFAAEFLVPLNAFEEIEPTMDDLASQLDSLALRFKVSTLVILRRMQEAKLLTEDEFKNAYETELRRVLALTAGGSGGGNFYNTLPVRVSERFARAVVISTLEGQTLYRDAFQMLGFRKQSTFDQLVVELKVAS